MKYNELSQEEKVQLMREMQESGDLNLEVTQAEESNVKELPQERRVIEKPTSILELKEVSAGRLVELPPFAEGQRFIARLKRPSMLVLVKSGKIPNELISQANTLFAKGGNAMDVQDTEMMSNLFKIIDSICEASFVEPTYAELKKAGIELTDDQLMFIFNYSQKGVHALKSFR